jgi:hypothetical protein
MLSGLPDYQIYQHFEINICQTFGIKLASYCMLIRGERYL